MRSAIFSLLIIAISCASCAHSKKISSDSTATVASSSTNPSAGPDASTDGSSFEKAVVIDQSNETKGIHAEYEWLKKNYPGYKMISQSLSYNDSKPFDILHFETADGEKKKIYFDISKFYGKW